MTLEALLSFVGLVLAVLAITDPVQRRSMVIFGKPWLLWSLVVAALVLIICRDLPLGIPPPFGWRLDLVSYSLSLISFLLPILGLIVSWVSWRAAQITLKNSRNVAELIRIAILEDRIQEVERIAQKNLNRFQLLPKSCAMAFFQQKLVAALVSSDSWVHLDLLSTRKTLASLDDPLLAVETVARAILREEASPLRSAVVARFGGVEPFSFSEEHRRLIEQSFQNPKWYVASNAHYALTMAAIEALRKGTLDDVYNKPDPDYAAIQGVSSRVKCLIYIVIKTEFLAIESGIRKGIGGDYYVTNLWNIFDEVLSRSRFDARRRNPSIPGEPTTPYQYILTCITEDLRSLSEECLAAHIKSGKSVTREIAGQIAKAWAPCIWRISMHGELDADFRLDVIKRYLTFLLALRGQPSELLHRPVNEDVPDVDLWTQLFLGDLQELIANDDTAKASIESALSSLDLGKRYINENVDWLRHELV